MTQVSAWVVLCWSLYPYRLIHIKFGKFKGQHTVLKTKLDIAAAYKSDSPVDIPRTGQFQAISRKWNRLVEADAEVPRVVDYGNEVEASGSIGVICDFRHFRQIRLDLPDAQYMPQQVASKAQVRRVALPVKEFAGFPGNKHSLALAVIPRDKARVIAENGRVGALRWAERLWRDQLAMFGRIG